MKNFALLTLVVSMLSLSGCKALPKDEPVITSTNHKVIFDVSYSNPKDTKTAIKSIKGLGEAKSALYGYRIRPMIYLTGDKQSIMIVKAADGGDGRFWMLDGAQLSYKDLGNGVIESTSFDTYLLQRTAGLQQETVVKNSRPDFNEFLYPIEELLNDLGNTTSFVDISIPSEYSPEATLATISRELSGRVKNANFTGIISYEGKDLRVNGTVEPYKNGSIIAGVAEVPVKVDGTRYVYGVRSDEVIAEINKALNK